VGVKLAFRFNFKPEISEKSVLRVIFVTRRRTTAGRFRKLHTEEHYYFCSSPNEEYYCLASHVACIAKRRDVYRV